MFSISSISKKLIEKLRRKPYRDAYVSEHVRRGISAQIRSMRDQRGWSQGKLSNLMEKPQSVVSRLEDPNYGKVTIQTLLEVAATFDVALSIRFVSYPTFLAQTRDLTGAAMQVDSFDPNLFAGRKASWPNPQQKGNAIVWDTLSQTIDEDVRNYGEATTANVADFPADLLRYHHVSTGVGHA
jgi:transcriptional regulator with XRE-family HTH domain